MVSELATNAVQHARSDFEVTITSARGGICAEVSDTGGGHPAARHATPAQETGRGLKIVAALADSWGVSPRATGKAVWFAINLQTASASSPALGTPSQTP